MDEAHFACLVFNVVWPFFFQVSSAGGGEPVPPPAAIIPGSSSRARAGGSNKQDTAKGLDEFKTLSSTKQVRDIII